MTSERFMRRAIALSREGMLGGNVRAARADRKKGSGNSDDRK